MNFRTISQLPKFVPSESTQFSDNDLIEFSKYLPPPSDEPNAPKRYQSYCVTTENFAEFVKDKAIIQLKGEEFGQQHSEMWKWLSKIVENSGPLSSNSLTMEGQQLIFTYAPNITETIEEFGSDSGKKSVNVDTMRKFMSGNSPLFIAPDSKFSTSYFNVENNITLETDVPPSVNGEKHNEYLFMITRTTSNEWITTESGIFTCYGWVDEETEGDPDNSRRWVALEGKIDDEWRILQLQPFIHNLYCTYVGFTIPVQKGLSLRLRTGFKVGTNSNKYQSSQGSLTNHIANAFIGGVYKTVSMNQSYSETFPRNDPNATWNDTRRAVIQKPKSSTTKALREKLEEIIDFLNSEK